MACLLRNIHDPADNLYEKLQGRLTFVIFLALGYDPPADAEEKTNETVTSKSRQTTHFSAIVLYRRNATDRFRNGLYFDSLGASALLNVFHEVFKTHGISYSSVSHV